MSQTANFMLALAGEVLADVNKKIERRDEKIAALERENLELKLKIALIEELRHARQS